MKSDLVFLKKAGFNMLRKHIKVEPARYYYDADHLGMLIWQDMPSGGGEDQFLAGTSQYQAIRSEEHTSELQSLMRISYAVFCLKKKNIDNTNLLNFRTYIYERIIESTIQKKKM